MSLPLLHLPCCLSCPSHKPEPQTVLSAWNILRSQDQGPCYKHSPLHNPWGSWHTPKWCEVVSKNLRSTESEVPPYTQGVISGPAANHEGPCVLVEPGGRWLRSSHLCHPKLKGSLEFSSILPNNCLLSATWWSFLELPLRYYCRNFPCRPVAETAEDPHWNPGQETRPQMMQLTVCMLQLKNPHAATKTLSSQISITHTHTIASPAPH